MLRPPLNVPVPTKVRAAPGVKSIKPAMNPVIVTSPVAFPTDVVPVNELEPERKIKPGPVKLTVPLVPTKPPLTM
jgi:hypothetical protein